MPTFTVAVFRSQFPEFSDANVYPDAMITFWSTFALAQVNSCAWGTQALMGVSLYTAHELVLAARNQKSAAVGGDPGTFAGIASSKTLGNGTVSYDSASTSEKDAGYWNLSTYGKQFLRLSRLFGAGAVQL